MSSRRKISGWLYSEWIMRCSSCFTSAWKPRVSRSVAGALLRAIFAVDFGHFHHLRHDYGAGILPRPARPAAGRVAGLTGLASAFQ